MTPRNVPIRPGNRLATLAVLVGDGAPPTEFRLFVAGWNATENGDFLFDEEAAASLIAAREAWGVDVMVDLEHLSLDPKAPNYDPDARGWHRVEIRADGSCWAVQATWTEDGAERLTSKKQRYVSPVFSFDPVTRRVEELLNVAITALPATHDTPALVAARRQITPGRARALPAARPRARLSAGGQRMTIDELTQFAKIFKMDPKTATVEEIMARINGGPGDEEPAPEEAPAVSSADPAKEDPKAAPMAASALSSATVARLAALTGKTNPAEQVEEIARFRASHISLAESTAKLALDRAALETAERHGLVVQLVTSCGEKPATAWADDTATKPAEPWASMPLAALKARVAKLSTGKPSTSTTAAGFRPPAGGDGGGAEGLTADELAACADMKCEPKTFAALKAQRAGTARN